MEPNTATMQDFAKEMEWLELTVTFLLEPRSARVHMSRQMSHWWEQIRHSEDQVQERVPNGGKKPHAELLIRTSNRRCQPKIPKTPLASMPSVTFKLYVLKFKFQATSGNFEVPSQQFSLWYNLSETRKRQLLCVTSYDGRRKCEAEECTAEKEQRLKVTSFF